MASIPTTKEWLQGLADKDDDIPHCGYEDMSMMENLLHRIGYPHAKVDGYVYLDGKPYRWIPFIWRQKPITINSMAKKLLEDSARMMEGKDCNPW